MDILDIWLLGGLINAILFTLGTVYVITFSDIDDKVEAYVTAFIALMVAWVASIIFSCVLTLYLVLVGISLVYKKIVTRRIQ